VATLDIGECKFERIEIGAEKELLIPGDWLIRIKKQDRVYYYGMYDIPREIFHSRPSKPYGVTLNARLNSDMTIYYAGGSLRPETNKTVAVKNADHYFSSEETGKRIEAWSRQEAGK